MNLMPVLIVMLGGVACLTMLAFAFAGPSTGKRARARLEGVKERFSQSETVRAQVQMKRLLSSKQETRLEEMMRQLVPNPALLRQRLERTGKTWTLGGYMMTSAGIAVIILAVATTQGIPLILGLLFAIMVGLAVPHMAVGMLIKRRIASFTTSFPDAIDLLVRGLRSGLPISETLTVVAKEIPDPVGSEFRAVSDRIRIGRTMEQALQETADRLGTPEFQFFVITLAIQRETGGNLAETLSNLSDVLRKRAQMKLKIKAMSSESKASAYIVGCLPFVVFGMVWMVNPGYMANFFVDPRLIIAGVGGLIWMSIGAFVMAKMVNFEI